MFRVLRIRKKEQGKKVEEQRIRVEIQGIVNKTFES